VNISRKTKQKWRNRLIFVAVIAIGIGAYVFYINMFTIYDFSHLTRTQDFGPIRPFEPMGGTEVDGMVQVAETPYLALYVDTYTTAIAVVDRRNGFVWHSTPPGVDRDPIANAMEVGTMRSHVSFRFFDEGRRRNTRRLFPSSKYYGQFEKFSIPNGVRFEYVIGSLDIGIAAIPTLIEEEHFQYRVAAHAVERDDIRLLQQFWHPSRDHEGFRQMTAAVGDSRIHTENMLNFFERIGWTFEETYAANELSGVEVEVSFDFFDMALEFVLDGDRLIVNLPLSEFTTDTPAQPFYLYLMQFFGAGGSDDEGFMMVPSGSGGLIMFNNGKHREDPFRSSVYGMDALMNILRPTVTQPVRLPVFGIQNNGAAILAHVYNGAALATVNAEVAGRTNSYNNAWFSFTLRSSTNLAMDGIPGVAGDLTVVQEEVYSGDITVIYHFLAGDNPGVGAMAQAYQGFLVETGALTPLDGPGDRSFYLDILGALDVRRHVLGVPYPSTEVMTTLDDANRFVDILNSGGVETIQMQLHGWFNRGINHDVATNIRRINSVGSRQDMLDLNQRLQGSGGGLHPAVNFQLTNWYTRRFNRTFETAKDLAGYIGFMSRVNRQSLTVRFNHHLNDWFLLVHPGVLPFHVDDFLSAYESRTGMDGLMLTDLGDILVESMYRRDPVDRQHSRHITAEQVGRINSAIPNLVIAGGNDFIFPYASHIIDAPIEPDIQYIIDYEVPFFPMVVHGFIEFAGRPVNVREHFNPRNVLLLSMSTGASPRYLFSEAPTRNLQFSPHERFYSTHYVNWIDLAMEHYRVFNDVYRNLRGERIVDFEILAGRYLYVGGAQVTVTVFSDGTRIYVNNTTQPFEADGLIIPPEWFVVSAVEDGIFIPPVVGEG